MTEIFQLEQSNPLFAAQSPSAILATIRSKNRSRKVRTLPSQRQNTEEAITGNSSSVAQTDDKSAISKLQSKQPTPQCVFGEYFDEGDISSPLKKKKKKTILRRISRKSQPSEVLGKLPLESSSSTATDKDSSISDTTPKSKKVKKVTFADQLETYESPRLSKVSSVVALRTKDSPQHKEGDMQMFQKILLSKFAVESLPKISTPENNRNAQFSPMEPLRSRFHARSDQTLGAFTSVGKRNSNYDESGEISLTRLPLIISPNNTKTNQESLTTINSSSPRQSLSLRGGSVPFVDLTKLGNFNLLAPTSSVPLSGRHYNNDNCLLKNSGFWRRDLTDRDTELRLEAVPQMTTPLGTNLEDLKLKTHGTVKMLIRKTHI